MVRRGWFQLDVPTGWVQIVRGPRPESVTWPRANTQPTKPQVASAKPPGGQRRTGVAPQTRPRLSPEAMVGVSLSKVAKLEKALEVLGDTECPVYEAMQAELKRVKSAAQLQPASVRLEQCRSFIERANERISDLEAEKAFQEAELKEAEVRLVRLEAEVAAHSSRVGRTSGQSPCAIAKDGGRTSCSIGRKRKAVCRGQGRAGHHIPPMPGLIAGELTRWIEDIRIFRKL